MTGSIGTCGGRVGGRNIPTGTRNFGHAGISHVGVDGRIELKKEWKESSFLSLLEYTAAATKYFT